MKKDSEQMVFLSGRKLKKKNRKEPKRDKTGIFETRNLFQISAFFLNHHCLLPRARHV